MTDASAVDADQQLGGGVPDRIKRLYDTSQERWGVEQWRNVALDLLEKVERAHTQVQIISDELASTMAIAHELFAMCKRGTLHTAFLRKLNNEVRDGRVKWIIKPPRKPPGRPKRMTLDLAVSYLALATSRGSKALAARHLAAGQLVARNDVKIKQRTATEANKMALAAKLVRAHLVQKHGESLLKTFYEAKNLGIDSTLLWKSKRKKSSRKS